VVKLYAHQEAMAQFAVDHDRIMNHSDPGTGKTIGTLSGYLRRRAGQRAKRMLVVAPLSILKPAWGDDINRLCDLRWAIAHGSPDKRRAAFESGAEIVLINHDGVKWLTTKRGRTMVLDPAKAKYLADFTDLVIDEYTAFKHHTSDRSKAMRLVAGTIPHLTMLSGTSIPNTVLDIWHPALMLDGGARLGSRYFQFRSQVCVPTQVGPRPEHVRWADKEDAAEIVADALSDVTLRFRFEDCVDIPENVVRHMLVDTPPAVLKAYKEMELRGQTEAKTGTVSAINAAARVTKMLQIMSGAAYDSTGGTHSIHDERYDLVMQLVQEREHSVVAFLWQHQKEALKQKAEKLGISYAFIDGSVSMNDRAEIVDRFQAGEYQVLFCHPQSAGHGLTLTRGTTTIWASPTYNAEHFQQFNRRIYRTGQTQRTETICIAARGTKEEDVYAVLETKLGRMTDLLGIFETQTRDAAA
jgi:hypothetical protein